MTDSITVIGSGSATAVPDVVQLTMAARAESTEVAEALQRCQQAGNALAQTLREQGVATSDLTTLGLSVDTRWGQQGETMGYEAAHRFAVTWRDVDTVGDLLRSAAQAAGNAWRLESLHLAVSEPAGIVGQARAAAYDDALAQAKDLARLTNRELGAVSTIDLPSPEGPGPMLRMAMSGDAGGVLAGEQAIEVRLRVRWSLR